MGASATYVCATPPSYSSPACQPYGSVVSCKWISHVTYADKSCFMYAWIASHTRMNHSLPPTLPPSMPPCLSLSLSHTHTLSPTLFLCLAFSLWLTHLTARSRTYPSRLCCHQYDSFHWKCYLPETHQIEKSTFLIISWQKSKLQFWLNSNLYEEFKFLNMADFGVVAFSEESVIWGGR